jgi:hypothetical protein
MKYPSKIVLVSVFQLLDVFGSGRLSNVGVDCFIQLAPQVVAKTKPAMVALQAQFANRTVRKRCEALVDHTEPLTYPPNRV